MADTETNNTGISEKISVEASLKLQPFINSVIRGKRAFIEARLQQITAKKEKYAAI